MPSIFARSWNASDDVARCRHKHGLGNAWPEAVSVPEIDGRGPGLRPKQKARVSRCSCVPCRGTPVTLQSARIPLFWKINGLGKKFGAQGRIAPSTSNQRLNGRWGSRLFHGVMRLSFVTAPPKFGSWNLTAESSQSPCKAYDLWRALESIAASRQHEGPEDWSRRQAAPAVRHLARIPARVRRLQGNARLTARRNRCSQNHSSA